MPDEPGSAETPETPEPPDPVEAAAAALRRATRSTPPPRKGARPKKPTYSNDRDPQPLNRAMEAFIADQGWQDESAVAVLMGQWPQIVGEDLAAHVHPVSFAEGQLTLQAESTTWASQVRLLLPSLHTAIDSAVGARVVTRIHVQGPAAPSWTSGPRRVKGRGPRDTYG